MTARLAGEILDGVWQFETLHPEWTEEEGGEEGWDPLVGWWAVRAPAGLVLVDPLIDDWSASDALVEGEGGCAGIVRTLHWHQRSVSEAAQRYHVQVWAKPYQGEREAPPCDREVADRDELFDRIVAYEVERDDEIALWLPQQQALIFGDVMLRREEGELRMCPESWLQPPGGPARLRDLVAGLAELPVEHVLVSHGPLSLGDGQASLRRAIG